MMMMFQGQKHIIECTCVLSQYRDLPNPPYFSFTVFSILKDDIVIPKYVECIHCGVVHYVTELCKSIVTNTTQHNIATIDSVAEALPQQICNILRDYSAPLCLYEEVKFILEYGIWGQSVVLTKEVVHLDNQVYNEGKKLLIKSYNSYSIEYWKSQY